MNIFDSIKSEATPQPYQRAVVAFDAVTMSTAILYCTALLEEYLREGMLDTEDLFEHGGSDNPVRGVWMWEGHVIGIVYPATPICAEEYDEELRGSWRELTPEEWGRLQQGNAPCTCDGLLGGSTKAVGDFVRRLS